MVEIINPDRYTAIIEIHLYGDVTLSDVTEVQENIYQNSLRKISLLIRVFEICDVSTLGDALPGFKGKWQAWSKVKKCAVLSNEISLSRPLGVLNSLIKDVSIKIFHPGEDTRALNWLKE